MGKNKNNTISLREGYAKGDGFIDDVGIESKTINISCKPYERIKPFIVKCPVCGKVNEIDDGDIIKSSCYCKSKKVIVGRNKKFFTLDVNISEGV